MQPRCINCNLILSEGTRFCTRCGTPVQPSIQGATPQSNSSGSGTLYKKLEHYRDKLLHTDGRNHSILLRRIRDKWCFDLTVVNEEKRVVDHALLDKRSIRIISKADKTELARKDNTRLRYLYRNVIQIERDKGLQETYLGFPFLVGNVNNEFHVRGPLILFPINLEYKQEGKLPGWYIVFPEDRKPILNRALMEAIRKKGGPSLTDSFSDDMEDLFNNIEDGKEIERNKEQEGKNTHIYINVSTGSKVSSIAGTLACMI